LAHEHAHGPVVNNLRRTFPTWHCHASAPVAQTPELDHSVVVPQLGPALAPAGGARGWPYRLRLSLAPLANVAEHVLPAAGGEGAGCESLDSTSGCGQVPEHVSPPLPSRPPRSRRACVGSYRAGPPRSPPATSHPPSNQL